MDIFTAYAYQKITLRPGGIRIVRPLGRSVYQQTQGFSLIRRLLLGNDIVLRLEQTLKAALLVLRRGIVFLGCCGRARARRIQECEQQIEACILHQTQGLLEILVCFARKTDNNIA